MPILLKECYNFYRIKYQQVYKPQIKTLPGGFFILSKAQVNKLI
ncbi:hypothetical protein DCCM_0548 [Desulfocucumis palustris]|uniref:Uncharacterized protein n=1 Tax=Desulfocucumis palustris TaxID=1898651 RepID=A0A2L2X8W0_9FIRM|nr:hypothetical protein DCCM_0548 [Desulfocucumis palustris]